MEYFVKKIKIINCNEIEQEAYLYIFAHHVLSSFNIAIAREITLFISLAMATLRGRVCYENRQLFE